MAETTNIGEVEHMITDAIANGARQCDVAYIYALIIKETGDGANWRFINSAITTKWAGRTALERVKRMAWRHLAEFLAVQR